MLSPITCVRWLVPADEQGNGMLNARLRRWDSSSAISITRPRPPPFFPLRAPLPQHNGNYPASNRSTDNWYTSTPLTPTISMSSPSPQLWRPREGIGRCYFGAFGVPVVND